MVNAVLQFTHEMDFNLISCSLTQSNSIIQKEAFSYFENLRNDVNGWKHCIENLINSRNQLNESGIFFCLSVIESYLKTRYEHDLAENQASLKQFIFTWFTSSSSPSYLASPYIRNKFAFLVNTVFLIDFPVHRWNTFFHDFLVHCQTQQNCDLFLRILLQINADVADREITRTPKENERNNLIKDMMRETCLLELAQFWFNVISTYQSTPSLVCLCLDVIGAYVSWIDISLITNDSIMSNLFNLFSNRDFRCSVCDCFNGILHKGMEPLNKAQLIEQFMNVEAIKDKLAQVNTLGLSEGEDVEDKEFVGKLSKLFNTIGIELIEAFKKLKPKQSSPSSEDVSNMAAFVAEAIESKFVILCQLFSHKMNHVSLQVHPFTREYIQWIKNNKVVKSADSVEMEAKYEEAVLILLKIIIAKCKYPVDYNFSSEDENEFEEFRKSCKILFDNLMLLNPTICINFICVNLIGPILSGWRGGNYGFSDVEIALYFFYMIGENTNLVSEQKKTANLLQLLVTSSVSSFPHSSVQLIYFELVLRYEKYFTQSLSFLVPQLLISFLDERGIKNSSLKVRGRVAQLFNRFVKTQMKSKSCDKLQSFAEDIMKRLQDFLKLDITDVPQENKDSMKKPSIFDDVRYYISEDDQLLLYETVAVLIVNNQNFDEAKKQIMLKNLLLEPVWTKYDEIYNKLEILLISSSVEVPKSIMNKINGEANGINEDSRLKHLSAKLAHMISLVARTSKAFSNIQTIKSINAQQIYLESFNLFVKGLKLNLNEDLLILIQSAIRQLLHRLIVCLDEVDIVPLLPIAIENIFLPNPNLNAKSVQELVPLVNQVVTKFKLSWMFQRDLIPFLKQMFLPLISSIFNLTSEPNLPFDEKQALQKSYYTFLSVLASNNVMDVFLILDTPMMEQILMTLVQGAVEFPDVSTQKGCFVVLKKIIEFQATPTITNGNKDMLNIAPSGLRQMGPIFVEFVYKTVVPACFYAPLRQNDDNQLTNECLSCLKSIQQVRGNEEFCSFLQSQFFPQHFPNFVRSNDLIQAFVVGDMKPLKNIFKLFLQQFKNIEVT